MGGQQIDTQHLPSDMIATELRQKKKCLKNALPANIMTNLTIVLRITAV